MKEENRHYLAPAGRAGQAGKRESEKFFVAPISGALPGRAMYRRFYS